ncbi:MAG: hypothetical protein AVDCRST_MAG55-294 [uncultured Rubrobacteraceae bacterium]|uniref:Uncharacterized protein n=1 Tax=uncultured Rubrobacteraceae bacterium TaxID=349277 RepID=A0A6J4NXM6_9ACTN|nr:MAG: hypothetical protein AVDCRST_MAG55-294 [uncultured Rubrobacteraceae bacterium]
MGAFRFLNSSTPTAAPRNALVLDFGFWLLFVSFATVGALVASRRPKNAIGWIFCWLGLSFSLGSASEEYALYALVTEVGSLPGAEGMLWLTSWLGGPIVFALFALVFLLFPDGRLPSRRWRPAIWLELVAVVCLVAFAFEPGPLGNLGLVRVSNPFGVRGAAALLDTLGWIGLFVTLAVAVAGGISLVVRFRRARGVERQQIKWFALSGVVFCAVFAAGPFLWALPQVPATAWIWPVLFLAGASTIPVTIGSAILRHRLYDIDLIVNRALVYGSLTATLVLVYAGSVVGLQSAFRGLSGQESTLAVVASTLAIAALFGPLRRRVQALVDRRFYRSKYDAGKTLEEFGARLREETDLDSLRDDVIGVVRETMQPAHVSLWLRPHGADE